MNLMNRLAALQLSPRQLFRRLDPIVMISVDTWVLAMIGVPILRWVWGDDALIGGIVLGVFLQVIASFITLSRAKGWGLRYAVLTVALIAPAAWAVEYIGHTTGFPFGAYVYTERLQPQIGGVPVLIPFAWLMMLPPAWAAARLILGDIPGIRGRLAFIGMSAITFTVWDLFLDPQMVLWNLWVWADPGALHYVGIPLSNYAGWLLASGAITALVMGVFHVIGRDLRDLPVLALMGIYIITWLLQTIGQLFFWGLPFPALVGFAAMGVCVVLALRGLAHMRGQLEVEKAAV